MERILRRLILGLFILLVSVTPMLVLPWTSELFELPKMMLVYVVTMLIVIVWLSYWPLTGKLPFKRTPLDIPILLFLASQILATIFSIHPYTSMWGWYTRFHGGLASTLSYVILFYALVTFWNVRFLGSISQKSKSENFVYLPWLIKIIIWSAVPVTLYGIAQHFGLDAHLWVQDVKARVFSTLGQPNWLAAYLLVIMPLGWWWYMSQHRYAKLPLLVSAIFYWALIYTGSRSGWLGFVVGFLVFILGTGLLIKFNKNFANCKSFIFKKIGLLSLLLGFISLVSSTPFSPSISELISHRLESGGSESVTVNVESEVVSENETNRDEYIPLITPSEDIRLLVWKGAWKLGQSHPWLGTGPETFGYTYYQVKPIEHNLTSEWDFLYNKAHNEYLNYLANSGWIGLSAYLLFIGWTVMYLVTYLFREKSSKTNSWLKSNKGISYHFLILASLSSFAGILVSNFFGFSVVIIGLYFLLIPGWVIASQGVLDKKNSSKKAKSVSKFDFIVWAGKLFVSLGVYLGLVAGGYGLMWVYDGFLADLEYSTAEKLLYARHPDKAVIYINKAITRRPKQALFHDLAAEAYADLAQISFLSEQDQLTRIYTDLALAESETVIKLNPHDVNLIKNRASMFISLGSIDEKYNQKALDTLEKAARLSPVDPKILYNVALLIAREGETEKALEVLEKSLQLKPNYTDSMYAMALFLHEQAMEDNQIVDTQSLKKAVEYLELFLNFDPTNAQIRDLMSEWKSQLEDEFNEVLR